MDTQATDKPVTTPNTDVAASAAATGAAQTQGTPTKEQIEAYLAGLKIPLKVNGSDVEVPFSEIKSHAQKGLASNQTWEEAKRMKEDAERIKAEAASKGDPTQLLTDALAKILNQNKPAAPVNPLDAIGNDPSAAFDVLPGAVREFGRQTGQTIEQLTAQLRQEKLDRDKAIADLQAAQVNREAWQDLDKELSLARAENPKFTARVVKDAEGNYDIDFGNESIVSREAFRLVKGKGVADVPDPRLGGRAGKAVGFAETARLLRADLRQRDEEEARALAAAKEAERRNAAGGGAVTSAATPVVPSEIAAMPDMVNGKPNTAKADALLKYSLSLVQ